MLKNLIMSAAAGGTIPIVINTPSVISPSGSLKKYIGYDSTIYVTGTDYSQASGTASPLTAMQIQVAIVSDFSAVSWDSGEFVVASSSTTFNADVIPEGSLYIRIRYKNSLGVWSLWSAGAAFTLTKVYAFTTGTNTGSIIVPSGKTSMTVKAWGSGASGESGLYGGGSIQGTTGGYARGTISVTPGETLSLVVGSNGSFGSGTGYGGQGASSNGGGRSGIYRAGTALVVAGGAGTNSYTYWHEGGYKDVFNPSSSTAGGQSGTGIPGGTGGGGYSQTFETYTFYAGAGGGGYEGGYSGNGGSNGYGGTNYVLPEATDTLNLAGAVRSTTVPQSSDPDFQAVGGLPSVSPSGSYTRGLILITFS